MYDEITTELFWDCECDEHYIHPKTETKCYICGMYSEDMPDSISTEVMQLVKDYRDFIYYIGNFGDGWFPVTYEEWKEME